VGRAEGVGIGACAAFGVGIACADPFATAWGLGSGAAAGSRSGRILAKYTNAFCNLGVSNFDAPWETIRVSMTIMAKPTMARREFTARIITAERASPKSKANTGAVLGSLNASAASWTALCSSGPMELSLIHRTSPVSSCREMAWVRFGSSAARTF
jgi:hypothetical protein